MADKQEQHSQYSGPINETKASLIVATTGILF